MRLVDNQTYAVHHSWRCAHKILKMQNYPLITIAYVLVSNLRTHALVQYDLQPYFPSVSHILQYISLYPEKYAIHFQTTKPFLLTNYPYWFYSRCFPCSFLFFEQLHILNVSIERFHTRYEAKYDIIIVENLPAGTDTQYSLTLRNTHNFALFTTTIYLVYYYRTFFLQNIEIYTPATKIIITRHITTFGLADIGFPMCNWYCVPRLYNLEHPQVIHQIVNRPTELHKFLFRTGNGRRAQSQRIGIHTYFSLVHKNRRHLCYEIVGTAKLNEVSMFCDDNMVAAIQLAISHNMSIEILGPGELLNGDVGTQLFDQYSIFIKGTPPRLSYRAISESTYSGDAYWSFIYCRLRFAEAKYKLWLNGYPRELWIILGLGFMFVISRKFESLTFAMGIMLGQEICLRPKKIIFLVVFAFFVRSMYENTITSDVLAPVEPKTYPGLREMVMDNVKILVHQTFLSDLSFEDKAAPEFRKSGIENLIKYSYEVTPADGSDQDDLIQKILRQHGQKFAFVAPENKANLLMQRITNLLFKKSLKNHRCYRLNQRVYPNFSFWLIHTINNNWIAETLRRMRDSGLLVAWDQWQSYLYALRSELILQTGTAQFLERNFQVVQLSHLFSVVLLCAAVYYGALFVFILELRLIENVRAWKKSNKFKKPFPLRRSQFQAEQKLAVRSKSV